MKCRSTRTRIRKFPRCASVVFATGRKTREYIEFINKSEIDKKTVNTDAILGQYQEKYQPVVRYPFSEYEAEYNTNIILEPETLLVQSAQVELSESVKNNLELVANGRLKEIK